MEQLTKDEIHNLVEIARIVKRIRVLRNKLKTLSELLITSKNSYEYPIKEEIEKLEKLLDSRLKEIK